MNKNILIGGVIFLVVLFAGAGLLLYSNGGSEKEESTLGAESKISNMTANEFKTAIDSGEYDLIDIRTEEEYQSGHISGSTNNDFYQSQEFDKYLDSLDKNKKYLIYCRSGNRSGQALNIMKGKGFSEVSDLAGGIGAWAYAGFPLEN